MDPNTLNRGLVARYLAGDCTRREDELIGRWVQENDHNRRKMRKFKRIWNVSEESRRAVREELNADASWNSLRQRLIDEKEFKGSGSSSRSGKSAVYDGTRASASIHSASRKLMRVAAVLLVGGLIGFLSYQYFYLPVPPAGDPVLREISTDRGQRVNLTLTDETRVLLNADSKLRLPANFEGDVREVYLQGEAYFNVSEDPGKPFLIHSSESVIRVLGTSFSVRSYPEDRQVLVAVEKGRISFETDDENSAGPRKKILTQGQLGRYDLNENIIEAEEPGDLSLYLSWMKGYMKFDDALMSRVAVELERRYDIQVTFEDPEIREMNLTAFLKSRSMRNVLDVITRSLKVEYRLKDNRVTFFKEN